MGEKRLALTTGEAARCCFVSSDTILNWIKAGRIAAQRTAGGQYRIRAATLRDFMRSQGMTTEVLDGQPDARPMCWAQHGDRQECAGCLVKYLGVRDCFKLMGLRPEVAGTRRDCERCEYFRRWSEDSDRKGEER